MVESVQSITLFPFKFSTFQFAVCKAYDNGQVIALDGDTKNSILVGNEGFVAEQNIVGVAMGCAARGRAVTFSSTFAAFFTRTFDHLRMAAVSQTSANFCGSQWCFNGYVVSLLSLM